MKLITDLFALTALLADTQAHYEGTPIPGIRYSAYRTTSASKRCDEFFAEVEPRLGKGKVVPKCRRWRDDPSQIENYIFQAAEVFNSGKCESWSVRVEGEYVTPQCDYMVNKAGQHWDSSAVESVYVAPSFGRRGRMRRDVDGLAKPPTVTMVDIEEVDGTGRKCMAWLVGPPNEMGVVEPTCAEWVEDALHSQNYRLVMAQLSRGTCEQWSVVVQNDRIMPKCTIGERSKEVRSR